jgi:hypothetical protein
VAFSISVDLPALTDETAWYRAEYWGFAVGQEASPVLDPHDGGLYVYTISDWQAARAYAAIRDHQDGIKHPSTG